VKGETVVLRGDKNFKLRIARSEKVTERWVLHVGTRRTGSTGGPGKEGNASEAGWVWGRILGDHREKKGRPKKDLKGGVDIRKRERGKV